MMRRLLLGSRTIESRTEYKYALLRAQLGLLIGSICLIYVFIDSLSGVFTYIPLYAIGILMAVLAVLTNRYHQYLASSITLLITAHLLVFVIASLENTQGGVFFYFMTTACMSLVVLQPHSRKLGLVFVVISILLAAVAFYGDPLFRVPIADEDYGRISFSVNFLLGLMSSVLILQFVMSRNEESEADLIQKNLELQKTNLELDRFVYSASHDMRAPLSTMLGLLNLAQRTKNLEEISTYHKMMLDRIRTMDGFIKEITDYSRNARLDLKMSPVVLRRLVEEISQSFDFLAGEARIRIEIDVPEDAEIITDKDRLSVILNNLIANSIKYHDIHKDDRYIKVHATNKENTCEITVEDNGIGIREEFQPRIFDMFFRASERSVGSGLGLYIVRETVQKLNGTITFTSEEGVGSTFRLSLPSSHTT